MPTIRVHHAQLTLPAAPVVRIHYAQLSLPEGRRIRIHHAQLTTPAASLAAIRIHHAQLTTPVSPDAAPPSGIQQLASNGAWWSAAVRQRTGGGWV